MAGIYIHIPFCQSKCYYCDFTSFTHKEKVFSHYIEALKKEISLYKTKNTTIKTIYFGGGTPSLLDSSYIEEVLNHLRENFSIEENAEITIEANPGTIHHKKIIHYKQMGINRISFGVQSIQDSILKNIGRIHSFLDVKENLLLAKHGGFLNINCDLIYGLPNQSLKDLKESIDYLAFMEIPHIAIYGLQIEENTVFHKLYQNNKLDLPSEDVVETMYDYMVDRLINLGYERYEISNFAKDNKYGKHNLAYWQDIEYFGFGAAAHGYLKKMRYNNISSVEDYINKLNNDEKVIEEKHVINKKENIEEYAFLSLRTKWGIDKKIFLAKFSICVNDLYGKVIEDLKNKDLVVEDENNIYLTTKGMKYGNLVFEKFLLDL